MFILIFSHRSTVSYFDLIFIYPLPHQPHTQYVYMEIKCIKFSDHTEMPKFWAIILE